VSPGGGTAGRGGRGGRGGAGGGGAPGAPAGSASCISPDGRTEAFIQNFNVALRPVRQPAPADAPGGRGGRGGRGGGNVEAAPVTMLSYDGSEGDAYQLMSFRWSPDS
jgi:hypothetical protein